MLNSRTSPLEREAFTVRIKAHCHHCAGGKARGHQFVRGQSASQAADRSWFVREQCVVTATNGELKLSCKGFRGDHSLGDLNLWKINRERWQKTSSPCGNHGSGVIRVGSVGEEVISLVERNEALRMT